MLLGFRSGEVIIRYTSGHEVEEEEEEDDDDGWTTKMPRSRC